MAAERTLYIVVHGVADQAPGETLGYFAGGLTSKLGAADYKTERLRIPEHDPDAVDNRSAASYDAHVMVDTRNGRILSEIFWADLSRFPISIFGIVEGLFTLMFGLRFVAYQAVHGLNSWSAKSLWWLSKLTYWALFGPLAAANVLGVLLFLFGMIWNLYDVDLNRMVKDRGEWGASQTFGKNEGYYAAGFACFAAMLLGAFSWIKRAGSEVRQCLGICLIVVALVAFAFSASARPWEILPWLSHLQCELVCAGVPTGGIVPYAMFTAFVMVASYLAACLFIFLSAIVFVASCCWTCLVVRLRRDPTFYHHEGKRAGRSTRGGSYHRSGLVATALPFITLLTWCVVTTFSWSAIVHILPTDAPLGVGYEVFLDRGMAAMSYWYGWLLLMVIALLIALFCWSRRRSKSCCHRIRWLAGVVGSLLESLVRHPQTRPVQGQRTKKDRARKPLCAWICPNRGYAALVKEDDGARLIVPPGVLYMVVVGCVVVPLIAWHRITVILELPQLDHYLQLLEGELVDLVGLLVSGLLLFGTVLIATVVKRVRLGFDIVYDVVTHFQYPTGQHPLPRPEVARARAAAGSPNANEATIPSKSVAEWMWTVLRAPRLERTVRYLLTSPFVPEPGKVKAAFPIRHAIEHRVRAVLRHYAVTLNTKEKEWNLVILSHSQGTMAVLEVLRESCVQPELDRFASCRLITMGSPFTHLYQHYFPHHYPPLADDYWLCLRKRFQGTSRWVNLYRVDDYVGREIDDGVAAAATAHAHENPDRVDVAAEAVAELVAATACVRNIPVRFGGHTGYWCDREVLAHLEALGWLPQPHPEPLPAEESEAGS